MTKERITQDERDVTLLHNMFKETWKNPFEFTSETLCAFQQESYHLMKILLTCTMRKKKENQYTSSLLLKDWRKEQYLFFHYLQFEAEIIQEKKCKDENFNGKRDYPKVR